MNHPSFSIDLNCDMGESFGIYCLGADEALLEHVSSANIACGFHAGDPATIRATVSAAAARKVAIGAHPGLPDLQGFGRRPMAISPQEAYDITVYQVAAVAGFARAAGHRLAHVKAHGALYNMAAKDEKLAEALARAVFDVDPGLTFFGLAGSLLIDAAIAVGLPVAREAFVDRTYQDDASLTPRRQADALITDVGVSEQQALRIVQQGYVVSTSGKEIALAADTLCIHGDQPNALQLARSLRKSFQHHGITVSAPQRG